MYCNIHRENECPDYAYGRCNYGCNAYLPGPNPDLEALKRDAYEKFKLQWTISHGITFKDILAAFSEFITGICVEAKECNDDVEEVLNNSDFGDWLEERGFRGQLWPCYEEWAETEWQGSGNS